jgi:hypothetical protein
LRRWPIAPLVRLLTSTRRTAAYDSYDSVAPMTPTISKAGPAVGLPIVGLLRTGPRALSN